MATNSIGSDILRSMGIGTFDVKTIAEAMANADVAGRKIAIEEKQSKAEMKLTGLNLIKQAFQGIQVGLKDLAKASTFSNMTAQSSDDTALGVKTTGTPSAGVYDVEILTRAQAHSLASAPVASQYSALGTGTLSLTVGGVSKDITLDATNNTLSGLKSAINAAGLPVNASIVNDGTGYRLVLASQQTGLGNAISLSAADDDGNNTDASGISQFIFGQGTNNMTQTVAAQDASFKVNGLSLTSSTNTATGVIEGVTLNLNKAEPGTIRTVTVGQDTTALSDKIKTLVEDFNAMDEVLDYLGSYEKDPNDPNKGSLAGDMTLRQARAQMREMMNFRLNDGTVQSLADVGIKTNRDGTVSLDETKLTQALTTSPDAVARLFSAIGAPSDPQVKFIGSSDKTVEGTYNLNVNQIARQALYLGNGAAGLATDPITIDGNNDTFALSINGTASTTLNLAQGTYTRENLAKMLQTAINNDTNLKAKGYTVAVSFDATNNRFQVGTDAFGSTSSINFTSLDTNMANDLGLVTGSGAAGSYAGQDVMGFLEKDGTQYTFVGSGQRVKINSFLTGAPRDLEFDVTGGATGARGTIDFGRGFAAGLDKVITDMMQSDFGLIGNRITSYESQQTKLEEQLKKVNERYETLVQRYSLQFGAVNDLQNQMKGLSTSLAATFKQLAGGNSN